MRIFCLPLLSLTLLACSAEAPQIHKAPAQGVQTQVHGGNDSHALKHKRKGVIIDNALIRPPLPGRTTAMGTLQIINMSLQDDVLLSAKTDLPGVTEIHTMLHEDGIMKMRRVENGLPITSGQSLILKGGADHLMIFNTEIKPDIKTAQLTLTFQHAGEIEVMAQIDDGMSNMDHSAH